MADDGYTAWYQAKLWQLLPGVYRAQDAVFPTVPGPLQELTNRIGAETATLRRSIDRLWENQSIETCDDWVIPYIGDLLATRLVASLDARAQRLDVANTIYYRRRAGTLGLLEELAGEIAGRSARAVEFFRRIGRTRHQFDPPIGNAFASVAKLWTADTTYNVGDQVVNAANLYQCTAGGVSAASGGPTGTGTGITDDEATWSFVDPAGALVPAVIEGLAGANSRTPAGGFADLRNAYAAANTNSAFDEFSHSADLRAGGQSFGWFNISHLGVFIWWLQSFPIIGATPVSNGAAEPCFSFDPSGREVALFAAGSGSPVSADDWVSPDEYQLPIPVRGVLWNAYPDQLYGSAFWVGLGGGGAPAPVPRQDLQIDPARGVFSFIGEPPLGEIVSTYHFGQLGRIGAGGFPPALLPPMDQPAALTTVADGADLETALADLEGDATISIGDSLTYAGPTAPLELAGALFLRAADSNRPMLRWPGGGGTWTITGTGQSLVLQGLWLQGADLVLTGNFASVTLRYVTLDPGSTGSDGALTGTAIDDMPLAATHLWVEASIGTLALTSCITGPIRTRNGGAIEQLTATDSIIQCIPTAGTEDYALQTDIGTVTLARCTVLGRAAVHRMQADTCILDDIATAEDAQHGCVRFTAYAQGSALHAPYESVLVPPVGPIFASRRFGEPDYARLRRLADAAIIGQPAGASILSGGPDGGEMGAYNSEGIALKKQGLAVKFEEYAPLGVFPVWIDAD